MAGNYSQQPYYGMPFPFPPPQMPQQAHSDPQSAFPDMSQAPFQHLPGLQPAAPSPQNVNSFAYGQNAQQPPLAPGETF